MKPLLQTILFTMAVPDPVAGLILYLIDRNYAAHSLDLGPALDARI